METSDLSFGICKFKYFNNPVLKFFMATAIKFRINHKDINLL